jgi:hypothetical protein
LTLGVEAGVGILTPVIFMDLENIEPTEKIIKNKKSINGMAYAIMNGDTNLLLSPPSRQGPLTGLVLFVAHAPDPC